MDAKLTRWSAIAVVAVFASIALVPKSLAAQAAPCRTASDTGAVAVRIASLALAKNDSASLVSAGLPYKPTQLSLVTDSTTCQAVLNSFNAHPDNAGAQISSGYIVRAGSAFILYVPSEEVSYFDQTYRYLFSQAFLH